jgi:hypothetical protein
VNLLLDDEESLLTSRVLFLLEELLDSGARGDETGGGGRGTFFCLTGLKLAVLRRLSWNAVTASAADEYRFAYRGARALDALEAVGTRKSTRTGFNNVADNNYLVLLPRRFSGEAFAFSVFAPVESTSSALLVSSSAVVGFDDSASVVDTRSETFTGLDSLELLVSVLIVLLLIVDEEVAGETDFLLSRSDFFNVDGVLIVLEINGPFGVNISFLDLDGLAGKLKQSLFHSGFAGFVAEFGEVENMVDFEPFEAVEGDSRKDLPLASLSIEDDETVLVDVLVFEAVNSLPVLEGDFGGV